MKQFICKNKASNYYIETGSTGSFLTPPGHASQMFSVEEYSGGVNTGSCSVEYAPETEYMPAEVKRAARDLLKKHPGNPKDKKWIEQVYTHLRHCYRLPDGKELTFGKFWGNADEEQHQNPEHHLAVIYIRKYDPSHKPRTDLF